MRPPTYILHLHPTASCSSPSSTVAFPSTLSSPPESAASALRARATAACAKAAVVARLNRTLHSTHSLAPLSADTTPLRIQPNCRGERLLWAAGGIALVPFGPGLKHCRAGSVCWFALADCGANAGASLRHLLLRTRFVSDDTIFAPHSAFLPLGGASGGGVLLYWYCPPASANYTLDMRLMWYRTSNAQVRRDGAAGVRVVDENERAWRPSLVARPASLIPRSKGRGGGGGGLKRHGVAAGRGGRRLMASDEERPVDVFLGAREPRCPRGLRCPLDFETAAYKALSLKCERESAIGSTIVLRVLENASSSSSTSHLEDCPPFGPQGSNGYWADSSSPHAPAAFAPAQVQAEERSHGRWVWASRRCRRVHLTRHTARKCLASRGRLRIHLHGDSQSRDLYVALARFLGLPVLDPDEMKKRTNVLGLKRHATGGSSEGGRGGHRVGLTQGYTWGSVQHPELLTQEVLDIKPDVVITNFALAHAPLVLPTLQAHADSWASYWRTKFAPITNVTSPQVLIYQRAGAFEAARGYGPLGLQAQDEVIMRALEPLGFVGLETLAPHSSRFDATEDGAHVRVNGSTMNGVISRLLGLACE